MHHFPKHSQAGSLVRLSATVDLSPYGMLPVGSTGVVQHLDDDVLTIKLDKAVEGFGDRLDVMSDNDEVLAALTLRRPGILASRWREPLRIAATALLSVFVWEAFVEPTVAAAAHLPDLDPFTIFLDMLLP
jgi:hypothetical protein